jgi:pimeloyl-ACP methyl ester carboxylesterase
MRFILGMYRIYFRLLALISVRAAGNAAIRLFSTPLQKKQKPIEKDVLTNAVKTRHSFIHKNQEEITLYQWGNGSKHALLVHGWEGNAGSMGAFVKPLTVAGYKVTAMDAPAHGDSRGKTTNLFMFSDAVAAATHHLGDVDLLISHSFGSAVSLYSTIRHPDIHFNKMVMLTTPDKLEVAFKEFADLLRLPDAVLLAMYDWVKRNYGVEVREVSVSGLASHLKVNKAMIIHDTEDKVIPYRFSEEVVKTLPQARLVAYKGIGHYRMLWNKDVMKNVFSFIHE